MRYLIFIFFTCFNTYSVNYLNNFNSNNFSCDIEHPEIKFLRYNHELVKIYFFDQDNKIIDHFWDGFLIIKDNPNKKYWIVYHEGGEANLELSDGYINFNGSGKILQNPALGSKLTNCKINI